MPGRTTFLVTAGPTAEDLDPVRFLTNRATGALGFATARAALAAGERVVLIHGPVAEELLESLPRTSRLKRHAVRSTAEMFEAVMRNEPEADVVAMTAAPADFTPARTLTAKLKKRRGGELTLRLKPTRDILGELGRRKSKRPPARPLVLLGFALETGVGRTAARREEARRREALRKLRDKNLDLVVLDAPAAMGATRAKFTVFFAAGRAPLQGRWRKEVLAKKLVRLGKELHAAAV